MRISLSHILQIFLAASMASGGKRCRQREEAGHIFCAEENACMRATVWKHWYNSSAVSFSCSLPFVLHVYSKSFYSFYVLMLCHLYPGMLCEGRRVTKHGGRQHVMGRPHGHGMLVMFSPLSGHIQIHLNVISHFDAVYREMSPPTSLVLCHGRRRSAVLLHSCLRLSDSE